MRDEIEICEEIWWKQAKEDLASANITFDAELYYVTVFLCYQAVEKGLKALYIKQRRRRAPQAHSVEKLGELAGAPKRYQQFLTELDPLYTKTMYPDAVHQIPPGCATYFVETVEGPQPSSLSAQRKEKVRLRVRGECQNHLICRAPMPAKLFSKKRAERWLKRTRGFFMALEKQFQGEIGKSKKMEEWTWRI